jgi:hypothetical protein
VERLGAGTGQEADLELADGKTIPPPEPAAIPSSPPPPATVELEADLELVRREVAGKARRIEELEAEKRGLAERVVALEEEVRSQGVKAPAKRPGFIPVNTVQGPATGDGLASLIDTLQQEADGLRAELVERDGRLRILEQGDPTGIVHELERIRRELQTRTEELSAAQDRLALAEKASAQSRAKASTAMEEKEAMASRSLETAGELRRAQEKVRELERQLESHPAGPGPGSQEAGMALPSWPAVPPATTPGRPSASSSQPAASLPAAPPPPPPPPRPPTGRHATLGPAAAAVSRPTPSAGMPAIPRLTPSAGQPAIPRLTPSAGQAAIPRLTPPAGQAAIPRLSPPAGLPAAPKAPRSPTLMMTSGHQHPAARPFGSPPGTPPAPAAPSRPDPFDVNTMPSAPPELFDVHTMPTATHPALPSPRRGGKDGSK